METLREVLAYGVGADEVEFFLSSEDVAAGFKQIRW
jgi:hypothetical protein